jgi:hypothetical protein
MVIAALSLNKCADFILSAVIFYKSYSGGKSTNLLYFFIIGGNMIVDLQVACTVFVFAFHKIWDMRVDVFHRSKAYLPG